MNAASLLQHFERISEAPGAVPRLRQFILDLAVRGKLVEQDPKDEPAAGLLKRIQIEKVRLVKEGKMRNPRTLEASEEDSEPFQIPVVWTWCRLSEVGAIIGGGTPPSADSENFAPGGSGIAWLTPADLGKRTDLYVSHGARDLTTEGLRFSSATLMPKGSVLFTSRAPIGYTAIAANEVSTNQGFKSVVPFIPACNLYIAVYFRAFGKWIDGKASGTTFREVSGKIVASLPFPLPPLAEQHRIVAKVDELMALCDRLEAARGDRESRRDRVVGASLHRLNNGADAESFREHTRFHLHHLPRLTMRPEHIQQLRQTILNLAVRGRLVPQDPNDEPVSEFLERIAHTKRQLVASKKLRKSKELEPLAEHEITFDIPARWAGTRLGTVYDVRDGTHDTPKYVDTGYPLITSKNLSSGRLSFDDIKLISEQDHRQISERSAVKGGDILLAMIGSIGNPVIVDTDRPFSIKNVALFKYYDRALSSPGYLCLFLQHAAGEMRQLAAGGLQPFVSLGLLRSYPIALPPLAEQHRIVAKVDELMALCDRLVAQLATAQTKSRRLLEASLDDALSGNGEILQEVLQT